MRVGADYYEAVWTRPDDPDGVFVIDQRFLPHTFVVERLGSVDDVAAAISDMHVRGAPLIGAVAAYGMVFAADGPDPEADARRLKETRPTAVNLAWAVDQLLAVIMRNEAKTARAKAAREAARQIVDGERERCRLIGEHGVAIIESIAASRPGPVQILTHCNAGWLACVDYGTATAPIYQAHETGIAVHVWVDETRPRNQGYLTAWELGQHGVPHTVITDNAGGLLMAQGKVDLVLVGSDRTALNGDVANKVGTYLKALAAFDNDVPFYVALPSSTIDTRISRGADIPIEYRSADEVHQVQGSTADGEATVRVTPEGSEALNPAFDVTPARLVSGLITERGICAASEPGIMGLFPSASDD